MASSIDFTKFVQLPNTHWADSRWGNASPQMRVYQYLWDKVTKCIYNGSNGKFHGRVLGGKPIPYKEIANALGISWSTVQRAVGFLEAHGFIRTHQTFIRASLSFDVLDCEKHVTDEQKAKVKEIQEKAVKAHEAVWGTAIAEMDADITLQTIRCPYCGGNDDQCACDFLCSKCPDGATTLYGFKAAKEHLKSGHLVPVKEAPKPVVPNPVQEPPTTKSCASVRKPQRPPYEDDGLTPYQRALKSQAARQAQQISRGFDFDAEEL
jgi:DNA-binding transcriptional regulator YhcF (GntR family)